MTKRKAKENLAQSTNSGQPLKHLNKTNLNSISQQIPKTIPSNSKKRKKKKEKSKNLIRDACEGRGMTVCERAKRKVGDHFNGMLQLVSLHLSLVSLLLFSFIP